MRKPIIVLTAFLLVAAAMVPVYADIPTIAWLGAANNGVKDPYYNMDVYAYKEGTIATLAVTVMNSTGPPGVKGFNVTDVYVSFDWGATYYSTQVGPKNQVSLTPTQSERTFFINFTVPSTANVSNLYPHSYTIYATYQYENSSNVWVTGTPYTYFGHDFVIYSTDQAAARSLLNIIDAFNTSGVAYESAQAQFLVDMAKNETITGTIYYQEGNFTLAKQSYTAALTDYNNAYSEEQSYQMMQQNLQTEQTQATIAQDNAFASFLNGFSTLWVLLGIGWVLLGIGYIIKWIRTRRPEPAPAAAIQA